MGIESDVLHALEVFTHVCVLYFLRRRADVVSTCRRLPNDVLLPDAPHLWTSQQCVAVFQQHLSEGARAQDGALAPDDFEAFGKVCNEFTDVYSHSSKRQQLLQDDWTNAGEQRESFESAHKRVSRIDDSVLCDLLMAPLRSCLSPGTFFQPDAAEAGAKVAAKLQVLRDSAQKAMVAQHEAVDSDEENKDAEDDEASGEKVDDGFDADVGDGVVDDEDDGYGVDDEDDGDGVDDEDNGDGVDDEDDGNEEADGDGFDDEDNGVYGNGDDNSNDDNPNHDLSLADDVASHDDGNDSIVGTRERVVARYVPNEDTADTLFEVNPWSSAAATGSVYTLGFIVFGSSNKWSDADLGTRLRWLEQCQEAGLPDSVLYWMTGMVLHSTDADAMVLHPPPPEIDIHQRQAKLRQIVIARCLASVAPAENPRRLLCSALPLPRAVELCIARPKGFGIFISSAGSLHQLQREFCLPLDVVDRAELRARGIVSNDQVFVEIVRRFRTNVSIVYVRGFFSIDDALLKWCAEYTKRFCWRYIWFEDTDVTPNFSENRDRCLTHFYLEPSMEEIERGQATSNRCVRPVCFRTAAELRLTAGEWDQPDAPPDTDLSLNDGSTMVDDVLTQLSTQQSYQYKGTRIRTSVSGVWKHRLQQWRLDVLKRSAARCLMIVSPPGAGKTQYMTDCLKPELLQAGVAVSDFDCSSDVLIRESLTDLLRGRVGSDGSALRVVVADEFHMLSESLKVEFFAFLLANASVHALLIGNRKDLTDERLLEQFQRADAANATGAQGIVECRLPVHHLVSEYCARSTEPAETLREQMHLTSWFFMAARALFSDDVLTYRTLDAVADSLRQRSPEAGLGAVLRDKLPHIGEFMAREVVRSVVALFGKLGRATLYSTRHNGGDDTSACKQAFRDLRREAPADPIELLVTTALLCGLFPVAKCGEHWPAPHRLAEKSVRGEVENPALERDENVLPSFPEYVSKHMPRSSEAHPIVRFCAWQRFCDAQMTPNKPARSIVAMLRLDVIDQPGFPRVVGRRSTKADLTKARAFSYAGDYTDLHWLRSMLSHNLAVDWQHAVETWKEHFITDVEALQQLLSVCPDPRLCITAIAPANLCVLLRTSNSLDFAATIVFNLLDSPFVRKVNDSFNPLYSAFWLLYRLAPQARSEERRSPLDPLADRDLGHDGDHEQAEPPSAPSCASLALALLARPVLRTSFWCWAAQHGGQFRQVFEPGKRSQQLYSDLVDVTCSVLHSPDAGVTPESLTAAARLWEAAFIGVVPSDMATGVASGFPLAVMLAVASHQFPAAVDAPPSVHRLARLLAGFGRIDDLERVAASALVVGSAPLEVRFDLQHVPPVLLARFVRGLLRSAEHCGTALHLRLQLAILHNAPPWFTPDDDVSRAEADVLADAARSEEFANRVYADALRRLPRGDALMASWADDKQSDAVRQYVRRKFIKLHGALDPALALEKHDEAARAEAQSRHTAEIEKFLVYHKKLNGRLTEEHHWLRHFYNKHVGEQGCTDFLKLGPSLDKYKNPTSTAMDLGRDGRFVGFRVIVLQLVVNDEEFHRISRQLNANTKGIVFELVRDADKFVDQLERTWYSVAVVTSDYKPMGAVEARFRAALRKQHERGGGVFLMGENSHFKKELSRYSDHDKGFFTEANAGADAIFGNRVLRMGGYYFGNNFVHSKLAGDTQLRRSNGSAKLDHLVMTGLTTIFEGSTVCTPFLLRAPVLHRDYTYTPLLTGGFRENEVTKKPRDLIVAIEPKDDTLAQKRRGRVLLDTGFTKLYCQWEEGGTSRYILNACVWLIGIDRRLVNFAPAASEHLAKKSMADYSFLNCPTDKL